MQKLFALVALHPEGVDRNNMSEAELLGHIVVALHPEGVDRNVYFGLFAKARRVALHPEGVDRNLGCRPVKGGN